MIIDVHAHLAYHKVYPKIFINAVSEDIKAMIGNNLNDDSGFIEKMINSRLDDPDCSKLIKQMDEAGIDKTVILMLDLGYKLEDAELSVEELHEFFYKVYLNNPERLIIFSGIDPRRGIKGCDLFEKSISEYKFRGLKLFPPCGYELDDSSLYPYYEICEHYGVPVLIHTGPALDSLKKESRYPESILKVSEKFKKVDFILGHAGVKDYQTGLTLAAQRENIFLDIAGFQIQLKDIDLIRKEMSDLCNKVPDQVMFGTGWPMFSISGKQKKWVDFIINLDIFHGDKLDKLLYINAGKILGIC